MVISTPPLFTIAFSLSHLLPADFDVEFVDNKWLGVFQMSCETWEGSCATF